MNPERRDKLLDVILYVVGPIFLVHGVLDTFDSSPEPAATFGVFLMGAAFVAKKWLKGRE